MKMVGSPFFYDKLDPFYGSTTFPTRASFDVTTSYKSAPHVQKVSVTKFSHEIPSHKENEVKCEKFLKSMEFHNEETDQ